MVKISFHGGHSAEFCDHAVSGSTTADIVQAYYENGFRHVAITEHRPPHNDEYLYPDEIEKGRTAQFLQDRFERYFLDCRNTLNAAWQEKMNLFFGFETEYYGSDPVEQTEQIIARHSPDLIVVSVHHVADIPIDFSKEEFQRAVESLGGVEAVHGRYYDQQYELIQALPPLMHGRPVVIGHFDLVRLFSSDYEPSEIVWRKIYRNIEAAVKQGCLFEVNSRAFKKSLSQPYPELTILQHIKRVGGEITLGDDSHGPEEVGLYYDRVLSMIGDYFRHVVALEWREGKICRRKIPVADGGEVQGD